MSNRRRLSILLAAAALASVAAVIAARLGLSAAATTAIAMACPVLLLMLHRGLQPVFAAADKAETLNGAPPPLPANGPDFRDWASATMNAGKVPLLACDKSHRIIFANPAAAAALDRPIIATGTGLFSVLAREPVLHALDGIGSGGEIALACAAADGGMLLNGTLRAGPDWYVVTFAARDPLDGAEREAALRRVMIHDLRRPLANMRAAAETISAFPGMELRERAAFDEVVVEECASMTKVIESLEAQAAQAQTPAAAADLHSQDLFNCLARDVARDHISLNMVGLPLWLHGDSHSLPLCLGRLTRRLAQASGRSAFEFEALLADRRIYLDLSWNGPAVPAATVDLWLNDCLDETGTTLRDVLDSHGSEPWSQLTRPDTAVLRLPLPPPTRPQFRIGESPVLPRPEMHDFDLLADHMNAGILTHVKLDDVCFVVFDSETTGLRPDHGDRLLQIGAVRVAQGRVLSGETFERLIDPGMAVPPQSIPYHGITDAMVQGKPPLPVIMPQFAAFVGNAVLAGHNLAFDLSFLRAAQGETGIAIRNPAVDTLVLAALLDPGYDLSLYAVAQRLGVPLLPRRSALSDAMIAAEILVRLLAAHRARGIETLGQLSQACMMSFGKGIG